MIIKAKRIRSSEKHIVRIPLNTELVIGVVKKNVKESIAEDSDFKKLIKAGDTLLPSSEYGPICDYNSRGKRVVRKDLPKIKAYRTIEWTWKQWRGRYDYDIMTKWVDVPYSKYPRDIIPAPAIEVTLSTNKKGEELFITKPIIYSKDNLEIITHIINIFLEIFSECEIFSSNLDNITLPEIKRVNWEILPKGKIPWESAKEKIKTLIDKVSEGNKKFTRHRIDILNLKEPDFVAIGIGGFQGYIIYGYEKTKTYILESIHYGNATYILKKGWENISKMTKSEIINQKLQEKRIIHNAGWAKGIRKFL